MPDTMATERFAASAAAAAWGNLEGARCLVDLGDPEGTERALENAEACAVNRRIGHDDAIRQHHRTRRQPARKLRITSPRNPIRFMAGQYHLSAGFLRVSAV